MDEFKPEDELKPDASDRRPTRPRKSSSAPKVKVPVSRQHMMMGIGILVLLLVVLGIGSALTGPDEKKPANNTANNGAAPSAGGSEKNIDLSGSTSMSGQQNATPSADGSAPQNTAGTAAPASSDGQSISMPSVSSTPTQAAPVDTPANQQRVTLPGDLNTALNNQQGSVDAAAQGAQGNSSLPTAPATVSGNGKAITPPAMRSETPARTSNSGTRETHASTPHKTAAATKPAPVKENNTRTTATRNSAPASSSGASKSLPSGGNYTLQLSGASKEESLNAWARKQNLSGYHVYKTTRNGEPWYVLVSGAYATPADAKRAVASLPAEVRAANPWVKPLSQVKKESQ
ncbi:MULTISPECIES: SPOR domain-containing protein [Pantoea]|uniref:Cell division protein DamX n=1 Tax=Pantoea trifolii TaxID=2968030 RepID=A0ABT1VR37_9GAMM|nr:MULTISPECIES: SPOR domain-containing protein [unclassified Pantoea]MCQ8229353.1 SPOR domain-containing protein [Pantoea sp. MMK2]MCQ8237527.1 SPOR domain-containing protein [Pantoea sp. MMK3]MCW6034011.1 SPOR domain-containing protein [Pantoea sp. JK]